MLKSIVLGFQDQKENKNMYSCCCHPIYYTTDPREWRNEEEKEKTYILELREINVSLFIGDINFYAENSKDSILKIRRVRTMDLGSSGQLFCGYPHHGLD